MPCLLVYSGKIGWLGKTPEEAVSVLCFSMNKSAHAEQVLPIFQSEAEEYVIPGSASSTETVAAAANCTKVMTKATNPHAIRGNISST